MAWANETDAAEFAASPLSLIQDKFPKFRGKSAGGNYSGRLQMSLPWKVWTCCDSGNFSKLRAPVWDLLFVDTKTKPAARSLRSGCRPGVNDPTAKRKKGISRCSDSASTFLVHSHKKRESTSHQSTHWFSVLTTAIFPRSEALCTVTAHFSE